MVHPLSERTQNDEKELKRLNSLEQRVVEVENELLRVSAAALEKRVAELEASLKESNEERDKLRQTISHMKGAEKNIIPSNKEDSIENKDGLFCSDDEKDDTDISNDDEISGVISINNKEEEIIYGRILKLIENMKSDCQKAINLKIPTESQLRTPTKISSKPPSPTDGLISPKMGRSRTPSVGTFSIPPSRAGTPLGQISATSIPTSRAGTPSGAISPPSPSQLSQISRMPTPAKSPSSPSHNRTSHLPSIPSRASTPSGTHPPSNFNNNIPVALPTKKRSNSRVSWTSSCPNTPPRPSSPPPSSFNLSTGIPRRLATC